MAENSSVRQLVALVLVAVAIGGVLYGAYWRRQGVSASQLEVDDKLLFSLYDKLERLEAKNAELLRRIQELEEEKEVAP